MDIRQNFPFERYGIPCHSPVGAREQYPGPSTPMLSGSACPHSSHAWPNYSLIWGRAEKNRNWWLFRTIWHLPQLPCPSTSWPSCQQPLRHRNCLGSGGKHCLEASFLPKARGDKLSLFFFYGQWFPE